MIYVYFCCKEDESLLELSVARLRELVKNPVIVVGVDNDLESRARVPAGCYAVPVVLHRVPSKTMSPAMGFEFVSMLQMLEFMQMYMEHFGATQCLKLDADMWCNDLKLLTPGDTVAPGLPEPDFVAPEAARALLPGPGCFRVSIWAVRWCIKFIREGARYNRWCPGRYAENVFFYHLLAQSRMSLYLIPYVTGYLAGYTQSEKGIPERVLTAGLVHCGEPLSNGLRVPREVVLTRMLLLKASCNTVQNNSTVY